MGNTSTMVTMVKILAALLEVPQNALVAFPAWMNASQLVGVTIPHGNHASATGLIAVEVFPSVLAMRAWIGFRMQAVVSFVMEGHGLELQSIVIPK
mmetsp:Transcript_54573/g.81281  ORF Transcript_54573/g.81281 Transcript_54573/m.81281 type:complete len:96 (-) Transcript_54573:124-411(-)